jgi:hypothetical protein
MLFIILILWIYFVNPVLKKFEFYLIENQFLNRSGLLFSESNLTFVHAFIFLSAFLALQVQETPFVELGSFLCFCVLFVGNFFFMDYYFKTALTSTKK